MLDEVFDLIDRARKSPYNQKIWRLSSIELSNLNFPVFNLHFAWLIEPSYPLVDFTNMIGIVQKRKLCFQIASYSIYFESFERWNHVALALKVFKVFNFHSHESKNRYFSILRVKLDHRGLLHIVAKHRWILWQLDVFVLLNGYWVASFAFACLFGT